MHIQIREYDDYIAVTCDGVLGLDEEAMRLMRDPEASLRQQIGDRSVRVMADLTTAAAVDPSSVGILLRPFMAQLRISGARIAIVESKVKEGHGIPLIPTRGPNRLSVAALQHLLKELAPVFSIPEEAARYLRTGLRNVQG